MPSYLEVTHQITCHFSETHMHPSSNTTEAARAQMTPRQESLQGALSRAAARFRNGTQEQGPTAVAAAVLLDARAGMGEELWASMLAAYPPAPQYLHALDS